MKTISVRVPYLRGQAYQLPDPAGGTCAIIYIDVPDGIDEDRLYDAWDAAEGDLEAALLLKRRIEKAAAAGLPWADLTARERGECALDAQARRAADRAAASETASRQARRLGQAEAAESRRAKNKPVEFYFGLAVKTLGAVPGWVALCEAAKGEIARHLAGLGVEPARIAELQALCTKRNALAWLNQKFPDRATRGTLASK